MNTGAVPGTSGLGMGMGMGAGRMAFGGGNGSSSAEGITSVIYAAIREEKYNEAITHLTVQLQAFPRSRAALSLLGYCYYACGDFRSSASAYEELLNYHPEVDSYKLYYAQCLYKAGLYPEAAKASQRVDNEQYSVRLLHLQAGIKYEEDDLGAARSLLAATPKDDPDTLVNSACITYKEGKYDEARAAFTEAVASSGYSPQLAYNIALCHYATKSYAHASKTLQGEKGGDEGKPTCAVSFVL